MHCAIARDSPAEIRSTRRDQLVNCSLHLNNSGARRAANRTDETNYETFHSLCELWNHNLITVPASHAHFRLPKHWQRVLLVSLQIPGRKREGIRRSVGLNSWNRRACNSRSGKDSSREREIQRIRRISQLLGNDCHELALNCIIIILIPISESSHIHRPLNCPIWS